MIKKIFYFLSAREKKIAVLLLFLSLVLAFIDLLSIVSIMPFIAVISNPSQIETNYFLNMMFKITGTVMGIKTHNEFLFYLGILVFIFLIFSITFRALVFYALNRFVHMREYSISKLLIESYLNQPYEWFLNRNSSEVGKSILSEVNTIVHQGLSPLIKLISQVIFTTIVIFFLLIIDYKLTLITFFIVSGAYYLINKITGRYLIRIGSERLKANELRFLAVNETFTATKEIKVGGLEKVFINRFSTPALILSKHGASYQIISDLPRFILEMVAFSGIMLMILYAMSSKGSFVNALPIIAVYTFAGYRLMPSAQQIYALSSSLKFIKPSITFLYNDLKNLNKKSINNNQDILTFEKEISLNNIHYIYPDSLTIVLKDINLKITAGTKVGFIGSTGCGKTTLIDIILGLLHPQKGALKVDGKIITKNNLQSWQRLIGYVPQNIYLLDDTIAANIALGTDSKDIDQMALKAASKIACLDKFVNSELPKKFQTKIGERGIRLSGGQRQRIGIARALYHKPKVLILDEATNALDDQTEREVMESINNMSKNITIIMISHQLGTLKNCDRIFKIENSNIKAYLN